MKKYIVLKNLKILRQLLINITRTLFNNYKKMKTINLWNNDIQIDEYILKKEKEINEKWVKQEVKYTLTNEELDIIQKATKEEENLAVHNDENYLENVKNWAIFLTIWNETMGFIFSFNYEFKWQDIFERGTLWINPKYREHGFWKYLMYKMTNHLNWKPIVSVTSNEIVQKINEILMEFEIIDPEGSFKESLEENWPLNDKYRYFVTKKVEELLY